VARDLGENRQQGVILLPSVAADTEPTLPTHKFLTPALDCDFVSASDSTTLTHSACAEDVAIDRRVNSRRRRVVYSRLFDRLAVSRILYSSAFEVRAASQEDVDLARTTDHAIGFSSNSRRP